jgi:hypothetical protein
MLKNGINSIEENGKEVEAFVLPLAHCGRQYNVNVSLYLTSRPQVRSVGWC